MIELEYGVELKITILKQLLCHKNVFLNRKWKADTQHHPWLLSANIDFSIAISVNAIGNLSAASDSENNMKEVFEYISEKWNKHEHKEQ